MSDIRESEGKSVQVLYVEEGGRYRADTGALRGVAGAAGAAARALPVAVVSVAGATRGGKSFLLDFCLRYLRATEAARQSGAWLGAADQALTGFNWRGGWARDTTGILLWSEPIILKHQVDGQEREIAVLLMDTQGTFDNVSTVKDCTTIFAMSTLISSVQIYNLAQIIREDDLQHLQLFTEYGKLAKEHENSKPFQSLIFRVRDWMCPYEHPYGAAGGGNYLKTIMQAQTNNTEIKELRDHIRSSFENVSCFLTPHPGMVVADQNFNGRLCDLQPEFIESLRDFVQSVLHPSNLIPKTINGRVVTMGELPTYFSSYLEIFNGDDLPTPRSIFQATSAAELEAALVACRERYSAHMALLSRGAACVPRASLPQHHAASLAAARDAFLARRTLAPAAVAAARLDSVIQELEGALSDRVAINHAMIMKAVGESRAAYEAAVARARRGDRLCLHPCDVPMLHTAAADAALVAYATAGPAGDDHDPHRDELLQWLAMKEVELGAINEASNAAARAAASALYDEVMRRSARGALSGAQLQKEHAHARAAAIAALRAARSQPPQHMDDDDGYLMKLVTKIDEEFSYWESLNNEKSKAALRDAVFSYSERMSRAWGEHACVHPSELRREHEAAAAAVADGLCAALGADDLADCPAEREQIELILEDRYSELVSTNEKTYSALVTSSYAEYCHRMDAKCAPSLSSILIIPWVDKVIVQLPKYHAAACTGARQHFRSQRRAADDDDDDNDDGGYMKKLNEKLKGGYDVYCNPINALAREFNLF